MAVAFSGGQEIGIQTIVQRYLLLNGELAKPVFSLLAAARGAPAFGALLTHRAICTLVPARFSTF